MSDDKIKERAEQVFGMAMSVCNLVPMPSQEAIRDWKRHFVRQVQAQLREALAEEMVEAVRIMLPMAAVGNNANPDYPDDVETSRCRITMGDCRAAARFVAEHVKKGD